MTELKRIPVGATLLWRKPLRLLFAVGCVVSVLASGRFTARLVIDGAISFAVIPVVEVLAFTVIYRTRLGRRLPLSQAADRFFDGQLPWLLWLAALAALGSVVPPRTIVSWFRPLAATLLVPIILSLPLDLRFFRDVMARPARAAVMDACLYRAIAWTAVGGYFLGASVWADIVVPLFFGVTGL